MIFNSVSCTVKDIAESRERRAQQSELFLKQYNSPLVVLTLNIPGEKKVSPLYEKAFEAGVNDLKILCSEKFKIKFFCVQNDFTGYNFFMSVAEDAVAIKKITTEFEERHFLGRIFDIDVIDVNGKKISREELGFPKRKCLICENDAFVCARSRAHSVKCLTDKIESLIGKYFEP
ncbi:MAG: citrate lyase holo-[Treponema sp.]|nr:citrate lyase holo-[acyl-carrier protein] synthase [Treponema sp.]